MKQAFITLIILVFSLAVKAQTITLYIDSLTQITQSINATPCDTICIVNHINYSHGFYTDTTDIYPDFLSQVYPDSIRGQAPSDTSWFYNTGTYTTLFIYHQAYPLLFVVHFSSCSIGGLFNNSIEEFAEVYPNPSSDRIWVSSKMTICNVNIMDVRGSIQEFETANQNAIDVSHLSQGVYWITISYSSGKLERKKFVRM